MNGAMTVEMILRLVDQATAPLRNVVSEVEKLDKAAQALGKGGAGGKIEPLFLGSSAIFVGSNARGL